MNVKKIALVIAMASGMAMSAANAAKDQGHGTITFKGSIIDAPCSISPESADQTIQLGQISNLALKDSGKSTPQKFSIKLTQCETATQKSVKITFAGTESVAQDGLLALMGTAKGASVAITTATGVVIPLGTESAAQTLLNGDNDLIFGAYLQGDGASAVIVPGTFTSVANFTLAYQ